MIKRHFNYDVAAQLNRYQGPVVGDPRSLYESCIYVIDLHRLLPTHKRSCVFQVVVRRLQDEVMSAGTGLLAASRTTKLAAAVAEQRLSPSAQLRSRRLPATAAACSLLSLLSASYNVDH